jgi:LysR family transcriptional regulator, glycine cleavage system transcriptional activator
MNMRAAYGFDQRYLFMQCMSGTHAWHWTVSHRLPPLAALRAFESAARHLSFTRAAQELHVTQTAISHQIRALEERLEVRLFRRLPRGLVLTEEAQRYLPAVRDAFARLETATAELLAGRAGGTLTASVLPSFAAKWLVPRLGRFRAAHPDIDLRISTSQHLVDFAREDVDIGIRMGRGHYPGLRVDRLFGETLVPVCSPALLEGEPALRRPEDLKHHVLLHEDDETGWRLWLELAGVEGVDVSRGLTLTDAAMVVQAAAEGQGVALGRTALAASDIAAGRLVRPFDVSMPHDLAYYLVCPEASAERPRTAAVRAWLLAEAERYQQELAELAPPSVRPARRSLDRSPARP